VIRQRRTGCANLELCVRQLADSVLVDSFVLRFR
jgi:hypothetical protein